MRLLVTTPLEVLVDVADVQHVRAEDATGAFGIQPGHAAFVSVLEISVVTWRAAGTEGRRARERHVAVRGGVLMMRDGSQVEIAARDGAVGDDLEQLQGEVLARYRTERAAESAARTSGTRLQLGAIRMIQRYLDAGRRPVANVPRPGGGPDRPLTDAPGMEDRS